MKLCEYANNLFGISFPSRTILQKKNIYVNQQQDIIQILFYLSYTASMAFPMIYRKHKSYIYITTFSRYYVEIRKVREKSPDMRIFRQDEGW
jgi:hypothetical protein